MNKENSLDKMKEILDALGIEIQITGRYEDYYNPWVIFKYRGIKIVDEQTEFDNVKSGGLKWFEGSHVRKDREDNILDEEQSERTDDKKNGSD